MPTLIGPAADRADTWLATTSVQAIAAAVSTPQRNVRIVR
jgi:hypothetical protein